MTEPRGGDGGGPPAVPVVAGGRSEARERAVHLLYEARMKDLRPADVLASQVVAPDPYASDLVEGVADNVDELDALIDELARGWSVERMPTLDLVVLEVACFELGHRADVPTAVVLSEATDLAGRYGTDDSPRFVNGLLSSAATRLRPPPGT